MTATRADVARAAGVSPALVSYVLNGGPRPVSIRARERVLQAVDELGYRPNQIARALRESRTRSIGMLMPDHYNPHFAELAQSVENAAFERDYVLTIGTTDNDSARELSYLQAFVDRQVDGLLLISATSDPDVSLITNAHIPVVLLDRAPPGSDFSTVVVDNFAAADFAVRHLLDHGRRNPACIGGPPEMEGVRNREAGWRAALASVGGQEPPQLTHSSFSREGGYAAMRRLIEGGNPPDAVFVMSDAQAIGAIRACTDAGLRVPHDIALVSFDGTAASTFTTPSLTSVDQGIDEMARIAVAVMLEQMTLTGGPAIHRVSRPSLRLGESCGCSPS